MKLLFVLGLFNSGSTATCQLLSRLRAVFPRPLFQDKMENAPLRDIMVEQWKQHPTVASDETVDLSAEIMGYFDGLFSALSDAKRLKNDKVLVFKCPIFALWINDILDALDAISPAYGMETDRDCAILVTDRRIEESVARLKARRWYSRAEEIQNHIANRLGFILGDDNYNGVPLDTIWWEDTKKYPLEAAKRLKELYDLPGDPEYAAEAIIDKTTPKE